MANFFHSLVVLKVYIISPEAPRLSLVPAQVYSWQGKATEKEFAPFLPIICPLSAQAPVSIPFPLETSGNIPFSFNSVGPSTAEVHVVSLGQLSGMPLSYWNKDLSMNFSEDLW